MCYCLTEYIIICDRLWEKSPLPRGYKVFVIGILH